MITAKRYWFTFLIAMLALLLLVLNTVFTYRQARELMEANRWLLHTYEAIEVSDVMMQNLLLLGNTARAYLLTKDENQLNTLKELKGLVLKELDTLKNLTQDNPAQKKNLAEFDGYLKKRFLLIEELIQTINTAEKIKEDPNKVAVEVRESTAIVVKLDDIQNKVNHEEKRLLKLRLDMVFDHYRTMESLIIFGSILSILLLTGALVMMVKQLKLRAIAENKLEHLAYHDTLTGLVNRSYLSKRIEETIQICQRHAEKMALIFIDLDNFKDINDNYGHDVGDAVLKILAKRLLKNMRAIDTISRLGGDEFILILSGIHRREDVGIALDKILKLIRQKIKWNGVEFFLKCSVGISVYPEDGKEAKMLLKNADMAMYHAKEKGGDTYMYFSE